MSRRHTDVQGALVGAMAIWGLNVTAVKLLTTYFEPLVLASVRMVVACVALTVFVLWRRCGMPKLSLRQFAGISLGGFLMVYANQLLFVEGLQRSTATNAALIMALSPLISALLAAMAFREHLAASRLLGVVLGFSGVAAVVLSHPGSGLSSAGAGDLLLVCAVASFAAGGAIVQRLARQLHPLSISWVIYLVGTLFLVVHTALGPRSLAPGSSVLADWQAWGLVLFSGVLATAVCNLIWNRAIATIGVARTAVFLYWVPVFGVLFAALLLGESLTPWHGAGFVAVMAGTYLGTRRPTVAPVAGP